MIRDDGYTRYTVRIPTPLYERVKAAAGEKSVNAEIVATLKDRYPSPKPEIDTDVLTEWARQIRQMEDESEKRRRLEEVNRTLSADPEWSGWNLQLATMADEHGNITHGVVIWPPSAQ